MRFINTVHATQRPIVRHNAKHGDSGGVVARSPGDVPIAARGRAQMLITMCENTVRRCERQREGTDVQLLGVRRPVGLGAAGIAVPTVG